MSAKKLSNGEKKIVSAWNGSIKEAVKATGLSYGYCRKVLALDYIQEAIENLKDTGQEEKKTDKRIGNEFWKARSSHGRKPIFPDADILWEACLEYFEWVENNPLYEMKAFAYQGTVTTKELPRMRAMTIDGLCIFLDIDNSTWFEYCKKDGFSNVTRRVTSIIKDQKFSGAAADLLNANIIARDLGLRDKKVLTGEDGAPMEVKNVTMTKEQIEGEMKKRNIPIPEIT